MAEGGSSVSQRYYCHTCAEDIEPRQTEESLICPKCEQGFVECLEQEPSDGVDMSFDGFSDELSDDDMIHAHGMPDLMHLLSPAQFQRTSRGSRNLDHNYYQEMSIGEGTHVFSSPDGPMEFPAAIQPLLAHLPVSIHTQPNGQQVFVHGHHSGFDHDGRPVHPMAGLLSMVLGGGGGGGAANGIPGQMGDYVLGQGGLDAVISQLLESMDGPRAVPVSTDVIDQLPRVPITPELQAKQAACSVCFDEFELKMVTLQLQCSHLFHPDCILPWIREHNTCPVCRTTIDGSSTAGGSRQQPSDSAATSTATSGSTTAADASVGGGAGPVPASAWSMPSSTGAASSAAATAATSRQSVAASGGDSSTAAARIAPTSSLNARIAHTSSLIDAVSANAHSFWTSVGPMSGGQQLQAMAQQRLQSHEEQLRQRQLRHHQQQHQQQQRPQHSHSIGTSVDIELPQTSRLDPSQPNNSQNLDDDLD